MLFLAAGAPMVKEFIAAILKEKPKQHLKVKIADVKNTNLILLNKLSGKNFSGFVHVIDNYAVQHIHKRHPEIKISDYILIASIVSDPDKVYLSDQLSKIKTEVFVYEKKIGKYYYYLAEVRSGKMELATKTFYKTSRRATEDKFRSLTPIASPTEKELASTGKSSQVRKTKNPKRQSQSGEKMFRKLNRTEKVNLSSSAFKTL